MTNNTMINYVYNSSGKNEALKKRYREKQIWIATEDHCKIALYA